MTNIEYMDEEYIVYLVYSLNWRLPDSIQDEAMRKLERIHPDQVHLLLPHYGTDTWKNATKLLRKMGYPRNKRALPGLLGLCQNSSWPGFETVCDIFTDIGKEIMLPYVEQAMLHASKQRDEQWMDGLLSACEGLKLEDSHFAKLRQRNEEIS
ncbi:hypothetical protein [Aureibacillus halotolerans]|uniref:Uncharacterized protein n=1 Tax=Aureibacillus halotolerans TaxID=1508390 RepID=A0A4R6U8Q2_9BACI|nr:hypothetical protein [Aureibacillus halotolerans]TDQ41015.1 hypothetical protein EV213_10412 [Aureibacillus halotolerans]